MYQLIQTGQPYSADNGQNYVGQSGQDLFDIQYVDTNNLIPKRPYRFVFKFIEDDNVFIYDYPEYYYTFYLDDWFKKLIRA